jgi:hypothetical protein
MAPEQTSPYWDRIVGENWPQIPPSAWHGLADNAREGAAALNLVDVAKARRAFEETVQQSVGLAEIRRALVALEENPRTAAAALRAAADTFDTIGDLIRRTRNQILDVVADAAERIEQATRGDNNDDGEEGDAAEAEADRQATEAVLADAQGDVRDIVAAALSSLGPQDRGVGVGAFPVWHPADPEPPAGPGGTTTFRATTGPGSNPGPGFPATTDPCDPIRSSGRSS